MNNPEESAVTDLCHFVNLVLHGMIDIHRSAFELIRYGFSVRSLKDVVRRGSENAELIPQISDQIHHLVIYLNEEIITLCGKVSPIGMDDRHFIELHKRLQLIYEVWKATKVNEAYQNPLLMNHINASRDAIKIIYGECKDYHRWKELSTDLQEFFLDQKKEEISVIDEVEPALFAREDGVISSIAHEKAQSGDEGKKKQFVTKTEKVLSNYRAKNPDYKTMRELVKVKANFRLEGIYCDNLINEFISVWDTAIDLETEHPDEKYAFGALLKKVFMMMIDKRRNDFATKLFDKYKQDSNDVLPCLENFVESFQAGLTSAINGLPIDANVLSNNMELFEKKKDPIIWYLFISPSFTVQQLLSICVENKGYIPIVGRIFRSLPTLFERSISVTPLRFEEAKKEKLLITMLHRVFRIGRTTWTTSSQWENAGMMAMSFAKERKRKEGQPERTEDKALLDPFSLIKFALIELLKENRRPQKSVEVFMKMMQRLLANNNNTRMFTNYRFSTSFVDEGENVLPTPIIIQLMFDLLMEYDGQSFEVCESAREILKAIGGRLETDEVIFDEDTCNYFTESNFNGSPWWIKYSIYTWFSTSLRNPKKQLPSGVYKTIPEKFIDEFEQIKSEEISAVPECYLRSLFELGLFDVDLAISLLELGYRVKFEESAVEKMALALVDSYGKKMTKKSGGLDIGKLIMEMLKTFDPIRELTPLNTYCSSYLDSVKKVEHILVLFMAARISKEKQLCASRVRTDGIKQTSYDEVLSLNEVAEQLMDIFCETTKAHIEKEASEVERIRREANAIIFSPGTSSEQIKAMVEKDEREQSLTLQLTMIYLKCSHFCRLYQQVPIKLQQLMNSTLEKQFDSQKLLAKRVMDDVMTDQRKTEVVYAFVEPKEEQELVKGQEVVQPVKASEILVSRNQPSQMPTSSGSITAENAMFNFNDGEYSQRKGNHPGHRSGGRKPSFESEKSSSSRGGTRNDRNNSYRTNRWHPVHDTQTFNQRDREFIYKNTKTPSNNDYDRNMPRNDNMKNPFDQEKLYYDDRVTPFKLPNEGRSDDIRRYSESRDSNYDSSFENQARRWLSESENAHDDSENRFLDQTIRSVHNFSNREQFQHSSKPGPSNIQPQKGQERKQPKKGFNEFKFHGNHQKTQFQRKQRYPSSNYNEHEEEMPTRLKQGQPEREEIANVLGFNNRSPNPLTNRRGGFYNR